MYANVIRLSDRRRGKTPGFFGTPLPPGAVTRSDWKPSPTPGGKGCVSSLEDRRRLAAGRGLAFCRRHGTGENAPILFTFVPFGTEENGADLVQLVCRGWKLGLIPEEPPDYFLAKWIDVSRNPFHALRDLIADAYEPETADEAMELFDRGLYVYLPCTFAIDT